MRRSFSPLCQKRKAEIKRIYKLASEFPVVWQAKLSSTENNKKMLNGFKNYIFCLSQYIIHPHSLKTKNVRGYTWRPFSYLCSIYSHCAPSCLLQLIICICFLCILPFPSYLTMGLLHRPFLYFTFFICKSGFNSICLKRAYMRMNWFNIH